MLRVAHTSDAFDKNSLPLMQGKPKKKLVLILSGIVVLVALLAVCVVGFVKSTGTRPSPPETNNGMLLPLLYADVLV